MSVSFLCSACHSELNVESTQSGETIECPECHTYITAPEICLSPGTVIGGFQIESLIGEGGMGEVYLANQLSMDRKVAVKILHSDLNLDADEVASFMSEVRNVAKLEHPNIVTAYEAGEHEGIYYMAMAYVDGDSIADLIDRDGPIPEKKALEIVNSVASAMAYAYSEHGMIHRDIKPENIMLNNRGETKLMDLGLSLNLGEPDSSQENDMMVGTPNYMSPEQIETEQRPDLRADIYSLGATFYDMLTATTPFEGSDIDETLKNIAENSLPDPRETGAKISAGCVRLLEIMLAINPDYRHQTWEELLNDLKRTMKGGNPKTTAPPPGESMLIRSGSEKDASKKIVIDHSQINRLKQTDSKNKQPIKESQNFPLSIILLFLVVIAIGGGLVAMQIKKNNRADQIKLRSELAQQKKVRSSQLEKQLSAILKRMDINSGNFDRTIEQLEELQISAIGTSLEKEIDKALKKVKTLKENRVQKTFEKLKSKALQLASENKTSDAITLLRNYNGPFSEETSVERRELRKAIRTRN